MKIKHSLIFLILLVIIIPCTLTIVTASYQCRKAALGLIKHNIASTTSIRADSIDNYFKQREANMEILARMPQLTYLLETKPSDEEIYKRNMSTINNALSSRANNQPYVDEILCVNRFDTIVAGSDTSAIGELFKHVSNPHEIPAGDFLVSTVRTPDEKIVCYLTYPIFTDNSFDGYIVAIINRNYFKSVVNSDNLLESEKFVIFDAENRVITSNAPYINHPMAEMPENNNFDEQLKRIDLIENDKGEINFHVKNIKQMGYYVHLEKIGITVLSCIDSNYVNKETAGTTLFIAVAIAAIGLFAMLAIILFVQSLLTPVNSLLDVIERIEEGDLSARYNAKGKGEISRIASAFNSLVDNLVKKSSDLRQMNLDIKMTTENIPGGFLRCKLDDCFEITFASESLLKLINCTREEIATIYDNNAINFIYEPDRSKVRFEFEEQLKFGDIVEFEYRIVTKDNDICWILEKAQRVTDETGVPYLYCVLVDITSSKRTQEKLKQNDERFRIILEQSDNIIFEWDFKSDRLNYSPQWVGKFGYHPSTDNVLSVSFNEHAHPDDKKKLSRWLGEIYTGKGNNTNIEVRFKKSDETYLWTRIRSSVIYDDSGNAVKAIFLISDINADKEEIARLTLEAHTDMLTGLYNKVTTQSKVEQYISQMPAEERGAFYIIDLDNFKQINDSLGHLFGDSVLKEVSHTLCSAFPEPNIVGRIGGDEFIVFMNRVSEDSEITERADKLLKQLSACVHGGNDIQISASVGIALYPEHGRDFVSLYTHSDSALYLAKDSGKSRYAIYNDNIEGLSYVKTFETITAEATGNTSVFLEHFCKTILGMLYDVDNIRTGIANIFEMVGRHYNVSRMYLFENSDDNTRCTNTIEWCADDVPSRKELFVDIPYSEINMHQNEFDSQGIYYCSNIDDCGTDIYASVSKSSVRALLHCGIYDNGEFRGFIGFDDCNSGRFWTKDEIAILSYIAQIACVFLIKNRDINNKL